MQTPERLMLLAAGALFQAGCGLAVNLALHDEEPIKMASSDEPTAFVYAGEVRDGETFALVPEAVIEFWSEDRSYTPAVSLDGRGGFSLRVETCAERSSAADQAVQSIMVPGVPSVCNRWRREFELRARAGARCSRRLEASSEAGVVWLRPCGDMGWTDLTWRRAPPR